MIITRPGHAPSRRRIARAAGLSVAVATLVCAAGAAGHAGDADLAHALPQLSARFQVRFVGTSTLHAFEGTAAPASVDLEPVDGSTDTAPLLRADAAVPVATLTTGNDARDAKMRTMLDAEHHPTIRASFPRVDVRGLRTAVAAGNGELAFQLTIRDVTRDVAASISQWEETADRAIFDARFRLSLRQFGLEPPSVLGLLRVGDDVDVSVQAVVGAR